MRRALIVLSIVACGGHAPIAPAPAVVHRAPRLGPPPVPDPRVRGAGYLRALGEAIQPRWATFLEDCRLRLPPTHPLNSGRLTSSVELVIGLDGRLVKQHSLATSGVGDFETAISDVLADATPLPRPPRELASDDDLVHVRWQFARDVRQAGPATAAIEVHTLPLADVVAHLLERGDVTGAARRADASVAESVMVAALREALGSTSGAIRLAAVVAIGRAGVHALAADVRALLAPTVEDDLRVAAAEACSRLGDRAAAAPLLADLDGALHHRPRVAIASIAALVALGQAAEASKAVAAALPDPTALTALALAPVPDARGKLAGWFAHGDARTRAAVCAGLPDQALVRRGLADADATVRAVCIDAATAPSARLVELAGDRDQVVRAHAVAAIARLDPKHAVHAQRDTAAVVRAAAASAATPPELAALAEDRDADVRAAAIARLGPSVAARAIADPAPQVRLVAVEAADEAALARLARDDSPAVAMAATIALAGRQGRAAATPHLLDQLAANPPGSTERVRIALAWLLAR